MPKLSIITVNLNNKAGLQKTMESVFAQTFTDYEYVIIDGGSTDGSKELIEKHQNKFVYAVSEKDEGIYNAMNKGIVKATSEYLLFLNSGDYLIQCDVLENIFNQKINDDIIYGDIVWETNGNFTDGIFPSKLTFTYLNTASLPHQATFIRKQLFDVIGMYDENLPIIADWKFFVLALYRFNYTYQHFNTVISVCNRHGISCDPEKWPLIANGRKKVIDEYFSAFDSEITDMKKQLDLLYNESKELNYIKGLFGYRAHIKLQKLFRKKDN